MNGKAAKSGNKTILIILLIFVFIVLAVAGFIVFRILTDPLKNLSKKLAEGDINKAAHYLDIIDSMDNDTQEEAEDITLDYIYEIYDDFCDEKISYSEAKRTIRKLTDNFLSSSKKVKEILKDMEGKNTPQTATAVAAAPEEHAEAAQSGEAETVQNGEAVAAAEDISQETVSQTAENRMPENMVCHDGFLLVDPNLLGKDRATVERMLGVSLPDYDDFPWWIQEAGEHKVCYCDEAHFHFLDDILVAVVYEAYAYYDYDAYNGLREHLGESSYYNKSEFEEILRSRYVTGWDEGYYEVLVYDNYFDEQSHFDQIYALKSVYWWWDDQDQYIFR